MSQKKGPASKNTLKKRTVLEISSDEESEALFRKRPSITKKESAKKGASSLERVVDFVPQKARNACVFAKIFLCLHDSCFVFLRLSTISKDAQKKTGDVDSSDEQLEDALHKPSPSIVTKTLKKSVMSSEPILATPLQKPRTVNSPAWDIEEPGPSYVFSLLL